jgi:glycosyltransferase involved in cell wall biosynthesis
MPNGMPLVSVCIPAFRGADHIRFTVDSVLAQSLADFELIVVDDNSPDDTAQIVAEYRDPRIKLLRNDRNLGPEGNWNRCLAEARGRYFKLLPQDDVLAADCLERQVAVLETDTMQRIALVFCARDIVDTHGRKLLVRRYPGSASGSIPGQQVVRRCIRHGTNLIGEPGSVLFRRSLATEVGPFDASAPYVVDLDYWCRLLAKGDAFYLPQTLVSFRVSAGSWSVAIGKKQTADFCRLIAKVAKHSAVAPSAFDIAVGRRMAQLNTYLRLLFYRFFVSRGRAA